jgi:hypothetical protein
MAFLDGRHISRRRECAAGFKIENFSMRNDRSAVPKAASAAPSSDRHKYDRLSTRQPDALVEAVNVIARKRNTTVTAIMGEAAIKTVQENRALLPKKLQRRLRGFGLGET